MITIECEKCRKSITTSEDNIGRRGKCHGCNHEFTIALPSPVRNSKVHPDTVHASILRHTRRTAYCVMALLLIALSSVIRDTSAYFERESILHDVRDGFKSLIDQIGNRGAIGYTVEPTQQLQAEYIAQFMCDIDGTRHMLFVRFSEGQWHYNESPHRSIDASAIVAAMNMPN